MTAVTETRQTIAKQQVTLEQIVSFAESVKMEGDLSEREQSLANSVQLLAISLSETLERLSEQLK